MDIPQVSFTRGEASPIAAARTDAAFYQNALQLCANFFVRAEGAVSNRPGLQFIAQCASNTPNGSYLVPFIYNNEQAYLTEFGVSTISVYVNGAYVTNVGNLYALEDLPNLRWAQSADTLNVVVATTPPFQLKRLTPTSFGFSAPLILNGPLQDLNTDGTTTVYASATQGLVTLTASAAIFKPEHVGALFTIEEQFLASIQPWEANKQLATGGVSPVGQYCRSDGKIYLCVAAKASGTTTATGTFQPVHTSGTQADGTGTLILNLFEVSGVSWQFVSQAAGVALITAYVDPTHVHAVVQSDKGVYSNFSPTVVGGPVTVVGPFIFSGDGATFSFSPLTAITTGDPNQFYVTVDGIFQDPTTYTVDEGATSVTFNTAPATGTGNVIVVQVKGSLVDGLALSTYWAFGSFSEVQGYPATVVYFNDRLVFGGTLLQPQTAFTSKVSNYLDFGSSTPQLDSDGITFTMNARRENPIVDLIPLNDLLIGTASTMWRVTHSASVGAITPNDISLLPQNYYGEQAVPSVQTGDTVIYAEWGGRKIRDLVYQFQYDKFVGTELTVFARQMFPYGTTVTRMAYAPEPYGLLFCVRSDGVLCVCTYLPEQQVTAWSRYLTAGFFEDVCVLPEGGTFAVYVIVRRVVNGTTVRYIERFAPREYATIQDAYFVDSGLTYDGRNTTPTTMEFVSTAPTLNVTSVSLNIVGGSFTVVITTDISHNLTMGQKITLAGVVATGTYQVNGTWNVQSILSLNQFVIASGALHISGSYISGGVVETGTVFGYSGTVTASAPAFVISDPTHNNAIWLNDASGNRLCRLRIVRYLSSTEVSVIALDPVPASVIGVAITTWTFARTTFAGLTNLVGSTVSIYADGGVMPSQVVDSSGAITLPNAGGVVHAGLAYTCQLQSLNLNIQGQPSIRNRTKTISRLSVIVDESAPFFAGPDFTNLVPVIQRQFEDYGQPVALRTGVEHVNLQTEVTDDAYICIQHTDPVPLTILGWLADVNVGEAG